MRKCFMVLWFSLCGLTSVHANEQPCGQTAEPWPRWDYFQQHMITADGRVIDFSDERAITTSEGQSYALFFALIRHDQALFQRLVNWVQDNLANRDLSSHLPAWLWGQKEAGDWGIINANSASDADIWIAYALLEAGRLWHKPEYSAMAHRLLSLIEEQEMKYLPGLGWMLLPAPEGFAADNEWRLNPSYLPPALLARFAQENPQTVWPALQRASTRLLLESAPLGIAPDWVSWSGVSKQFVNRYEPDALSSYDAIRVYLWVGMMPESMQDADVLKARYGKIANWVTPDGALAENINSRTGQTSGERPLAFSAALLPLLQDSDKQVVLTERLAQEPFATNTYYSQMLSLFAEAWQRGYFRFNDNGELQLSAENCG